MGSFSVLCSVSHVPITQGNEAVEIYVGADIDPAQFGQFIYHPIMLPLFGVYNDYGELEEVDEKSIGWRVLQNMIKHDFKDVLYPTNRETEPYKIFKDEIHCGSRQILPDKWVNAKSEFVKSDERNRPSYQKHDTYELKKGNGTIADKFFVHRHVFDYFVDYYMKMDLSRYNQPKIIGQDVFDQVPDYVDAIIEKSKALAEMKELKYPWKDEKSLAFMKNYGLSHVYQLMNTDGNSTLHNNNETFNNLHPLNVLLNSSISEAYTPMHHGAMMAIRHIIDDTAEGVVQGDVDQRNKVIELIEGMVILDAFGRGMWWHGQNYTPFKGFAPGQYQDMKEAKDMLHMFNMFATVQQTKIDHMKEMWDEEE